MKIHTYLPVEMSSYLSQLAIRPGITQTRTKNELITLILAGFLSIKPWEARAWVWKRTQAHYVLVDGVRLVNPEWVMLHVQLIDIDVGGTRLEGDEVRRSLEALAHDEVPKRSSIDRGMASLMYSALLWATEEMFPRSKFGAKKIESPFASLTAPDLGPKQRHRK
ncbi:hypothetical protein [Methylibium sp.]|uniref:hypothetical protein n=1 Tax=Methylibium sp. TaxID=2067992 RepID=UPI0017F0B644|nr:hypothetical protein [Methylibium sp.]MBA3589056.1 hypothetical protein [Methylibium sp.]